MLLAVTCVVVVATYLASTKGPEPHVRKKFPQHFSDGSNMASAKWHPTAKIPVLVSLNTHVPDLPLWYSAAPEAPGGLLAPIPQPSAAPPQPPAGHTHTALIHSPQGHLEAGRRERLLQLLVRPCSRSALRPEVQTAQRQ